MQVLNQMWLETSWKCYSGEACRHFNHQTVGGKIWWQDQSIKSFFLRWLLTITQMWNLYRNYVLLWEMTITGTLAVNVIAFSTKYLPLFVQRLFQCCQVPGTTTLLPEDHCLHPCLSVCKVACDFILYLTIHRLIPVTASMFNRRFMRKGTLNLYLFSRSRWKISAR